MSDKSKSLLGLAAQIVAPYLVAVLLYGAYAFGYAQWSAESQLMAQRIAGGLIATFVAVWMVTPHYLVWSKTVGVPTKHKLKASRSMLYSSLKGAIQLPFSLSAFVVVPIIMLFVRAKDDKLPWIFDILYGDKNGLDGDNVWWTNKSYGNVGPNGEEVWEGVRVPPPVNPTPEEQAILDNSRYFKGLKQRTYAYRVLWLLRNRCTKLAVALGIKLKDFTQYRYWGPGLPPSMDKGVPGCQLIEHNGHYEVYNVSHLVTLFGKWPLQVRQRYGFKLGNETGPFQDSRWYMRDRKIEVINIAWSAKGYKKGIPRNQAADEVYTIDSPTQKIAQGTVMRAWCIGPNRYEEYANGEGGFYVRMVQLNSSLCGA